MMLGPAPSRVMTVELSSLAGGEVVKDELVATAFCVRKQRLKKIWPSEGRREKC